MATRRAIAGFDFEPGRRLAGKYEVQAFLGRGWEGEVYKVVESRTGVPRAMKVFYPERNVRDRAVRFYAKKLERLRDCPIVIKYHHSESFWYRGVRVTCLISEYVEGELLSRFLARQPGGRLHPFEALHLLRALAAGVEQIHARREYHGDIHDENILVRRRGVHFDLRLVDLYQCGRPDRSKMTEDVIQMIRVLYDAVGGARWYRRQPPPIKA
ncbi:MAG: serine/threonine protein kinase, partial [Acidobacteria bacterium]